MKAYLPSFFSFNSAIDLIRIGRDFDGGYLISKSDIEKTDLLIGLGVYDDWSFENDFIKYNDIEVWSFDASVDLKFWIKRIFVETIKNPFSFYFFRKIYSYKKFFKGKRKHIKKFIGLNANFEYYRTLSSVFNDTDKKNIFLKIDIEGSEYRLLNTLLLNQNRIAGLVIELHDCDIHLETIEKFIKKFKLNLVHIHATNIAPIRMDDKLPLVMELTFSKYAKLAHKHELPHKLDMPCSKNLEEIELVVNK